MSQEIDILFIYPATGWAPEAMRIAENDAPPMGLLYVAAAAQSAGLKVAVIDLNHFPAGEAGLADFVARSNPRIIGLSVLTTASSAAKRLIRHLKGQFPQTVLAAGGIHATVLPFDLLSAGCDYAVIGEGEATMVELARAVLARTSVAEVAGIAFLDGADRAAAIDDVDIGPHANRLVETTPTPVLRALDSLPLPARDLVPLVDYGQSGALLSSRGCPYRCSFCSSVLSHGHAYRQRTISAVMSEVDELLDRYGVDHLQFLDDNFTVNPERALELADAIGTRQVVWSCQATIMELGDRVEVLDRLFAAGCREIYFGMESGNRELLQRLKRIDLDQAMEVLGHAASLERTSKNGDAERLQTVVGFIVGHPEDDQSTIQDTFEVALGLRKMGIDTMVSIMQPYPGSLVHANPQHYGVVIENQDFSQYLYPKANISTRNLSRDAIRRLYASGLLRIIQTYHQQDG